MIEYTEPKPIYHIYDSPTAKTVAFKLLKTVLHRTIAQRPTHIDRKFPADSISIPIGLRFAFQATAERLAQHYQEMEELARKVQGGRASWKPVIAFHDGKVLHAGSGFETILAARTQSPVPTVPVTVYDGTINDAIQLAKDTGEAMKETK